MVWIVKNKCYAWHGVAEAIADFDEQGALIDELTGYRDQLLKGLSAKALRQSIKVEFSGCPMKRADRNRRGAPEGAASVRSVFFTVRILPEKGEEAGLVANAVLLKSESGTDQVLQVEKELSAVV